MFTFNHFNFNVTDLDRSLKFYKEALGHVPYDKWVKYVWKLILYFFLLTLAFLVAGVVIG